MYLRAPHLLARELGYLSTHSLQPLLEGGFWRVNPLSFRPVGAAGKGGTGDQRALGWEMHATDGRLARVPLGVARTRDVGGAPTLSVVGRS